MIVSVPFGVPLSGHAGVSHDHLCIVRDEKSGLAGWAGTLVDVGRAAGVIGNTGGIRTSASASRADALQFPGI